MVSVTGPTCASCVRGRRGAPDEFGGSPSGLEHLISRRSLPGMLRMWTRTGSHRFPGDPSYAFALLQDPGRAGKISPWRSCRCCPRATQAEGLNGYIISRLTQGLSIRCLRFTSGVTATHARLASGWRAAPLPGGGRTLWIASKGFRLHRHSPFQDLSCRKPSRWGRCHPHPSQTRTCRFPASGSSRERFAHGGVSMDDLDWGQRVASQDFVELGPSDPALPISPRQPLAPDPPNLIGEPA